jgi:adapter protein MecA 1/2
MKLERLNQDKIRIFLTFDDLLERGINKEDIWHDIPKVHELFNDMINQAYQELDFEISGPVAVEVYSLPAQGMVVIVTRGRGALRDQEEDDLEDYYELEVTLDESDDILFSFANFDDCIQVAHKITPFVDGRGKLYKYHGRYYLLLEGITLEEKDGDLLIALLSEYGEPSTQSKFVLNEYGTVIIDDQAVDVLCRYFKP